MASKYLVCIEKGKLVIEKVLMESAIFTAMEHLPKKSLLSKFP